MKKRIVITLVVCFLLFSVVLIMQYNTKNVSSYLEEDIAIQATPSKLEQNHEYSEDNTLPGSESTEYEYPEEDIAVQSTPDKMIIEHEYVEYE